MKTTVLSLTATLALTAAAVQAQEVRVYNWSDYIDEELLTQFEQETGIDLIYDVFDSNEVLETKMLAGGSGYDVVVPTGTFLQRQIQAGAFQPLDKSQLPNIDNMWDVVTKRTDVYDPGQEYAINYMWGTTGIGVNVDKVKEALGDDVPMNSWDLVFDPANMEKLASCGVHFLDAPAEMIPAALNYLGEDPDSHDPEVIARAMEVYEPIRGDIQKFHSSEYINALANGDICVAVGWSGDILQARDRAAEADNGVTVEYIIPKEGAQMWFDHGGGVELRLLRQRQQGVAGVSQRRRDRRSGDLPGPGDARQSLHHDALSTARAAYRDPALDRDQIRSLTRRHRPARHSCAGRFSCQKRGWYDEPEGLCPLGRCDRETPDPVQGRDQEIR